MKEAIGTILIGLFIGLLFILFLKNEPKGHYVESNQNEDIHYVWVEEWMDMKGYYTNSAYMGYIPSVGKYWQFESETAYRNYMKERGEAEC